MGREEDRRQKALDDEGKYLLEEISEAASSASFDFGRMEPILYATVSEVETQQALTLALLSNLAEAELARKVQDALASLVDRAVKLHATWVEIGRALGMTPQGAYKMHKKWLADRQVELETELDAELANESPHQADERRHEEALKEAAARIFEDPHNPAHRKALEELARSRRSA